MTIRPHTRKYVHACVELCVVTANNKPTNNLPLLGRQTFYAGGVHAKNKRRSDARTSADCCVRPSYASLASTQSKRDALVRTFQLPAGFLSWVVEVYTRIITFCIVIFQTTVQCVLTTVFRLVKQESPFQKCLFQLCCMYLYRLMLACLLAPHTVSTRTALEPPSSHKCSIHTPSSSSPLPSSLLLEKSIKPCLDAVHSFTLLVKHQHERIQTTGTTKQGVIE